MIAARVSVPVAAVVVSAAVAPVPFAPAIRAAIVVTLPLGGRLAIAGSLGFRAVLVDHLLSFFLGELRELHLGEGVIHRGHFEVGLHLHDGRVRDVLALLRDPLLSPDLGLLLRGDDDDGLALESRKVGHFPFLSCGVDVGLVQDVIPPPLGRYLQENVQAASALFDQHLPPERRRTICRDGKPTGRAGSIPDKLTFRCSFYGVGDR